MLCFSPCRTCCICEPSWAAASMTSGCISTLSCAISRALFSFWTATGAAPTPRRLQTRTHVYEWSVSVMMHRHSMLNTPCVHNNIIICCDARGNQVA